MKSVVFVLLFAVLLGASLGAQAPELFLPEGARGLTFGERLLAEIRLVGLTSGSDASLGVLPRVEGLEIASGPAEDRDGLRVWSLAIDALRPGRHLLPALAIDAGGETRKTEPIELEFVVRPLGGDHLQLLVEPDRRSLLTGEILSIDVRLRYDEEFFHRQALQPFGRRLGLPVQLTLPLWNGLEGMTPLDDVEEGAMTLVVNGTLARAHVEPADPSGDGLREVVLRRRFRATASGRIVIEAATARFEYASAFEDDFMAGRRPVDRLRGRVHAESVAISIGEPPLAGRPANWSGAVGRFTIATSLDRSATEQGEIFTLDLILRGSGNLEALNPPDLELPGFHQFGRRELERPDAESRAFRYDIAALIAGLTAFPAVEFAFYDPAIEPPGYVVTGSTPLPLVVSEVKGFVAPGVEEVGSRSQVATLADYLRELESSPREIFEVTPSMFWFVLTLPFVLAAAVFVVVEARRRDRDDPAAARARRARGQFHRDLRRAGAPLDWIFANYLAARLGRSAPAMLDRDHESALVAAGVDRALASSSSRLITALISARYGPAETAPGPEAVTDLVEALENDFRATGRKS